MSEFDQLRWRCRRGILELDMLLLRYLETAYPHANAAEQALFRTLLACEQPQLQAYLLDSQPAAPFAGLIGKIRDACVK